MLSPWRCGSLVGVESPQKGHIKGTGLRMGELLGVSPSGCILKELLGPVCCLMCDESSSRAHESNCLIGRL